MRLGHLELVTGISGDMWVGACLDAGWPAARLVEIPGLLGLSDVRIAVEERRQGSLVGLGIRVESREAHPHRGLPEIEAILMGGRLEPEVVARSREVFARLAAVEARVHGTSVEQVHFHEVGGLDAIIDVVGAVRALRDLDIAVLTAGSVPLVRGEIEGAHGLLPAPAPATAHLLVGWPIGPAEGDGEWVTPTGAALLSTLAVPAAGFPALVLEAVGTGAGTRAHPRLPNLLRLWIGRPAPVGPPAGAGEWAGAVVSVLETQLDDATGEEVGALVEDLRSQGALDVFVAAVQMKKGRPGVQLTVIARPERAEDLLAEIFRGSRTLGVRRRDQQRYERPRGAVRAPTPWGEVRLKWVGRPEDPAPEIEFDDLRRVARERGVSLQVAEQDIRVYLAGSSRSPGLRELG